MDNEELQALMRKQDEQLKRGEELIRRVVLEILRTKGILANGFSTPELDKEVKGSDGYSLGVANEDAPNS